MQRAKNLHSLDLFISLIHFENMNKRAAHQNITYIGWISVSAWVSSEGGRLVDGETNTGSGQPGTASNKNYLIETRNSVDNCLQL